MPFNWNLFPWTKFNEINLDWFLGQFKQTQDAMEHAEQAVETIDSYDERISYAERNATSAVQQAGEALATASDAQEVAEGIEGKADSAIATAGAAVDTANAANTRSTEDLTVANGLDAKATQALTDSQTALTDSGRAMSTASTAWSKANDAQADADSARADANQAITGVEALVDIVDNNEISFATNGWTRDWTPVDTTLATVTEKGYCNVSKNKHYAKMYHYFECHVINGSGSAWVPVCYHDFEGIEVSEAFDIQGIGLTFEGIKDSANIPTLVSNIYSINPSKIRVSPITGGARITVYGRIVQAGTKNFRVWFFGSILQLVQFE